MAGSIVTKTGDSGATKLLFGRQVSKSDERVEAYGAIDELNSFLGLARALCDDENIKALLEAIQRDSFIVGAELATPTEEIHRLKQRVSEAMTHGLEAHVAKLEERPGLLDDWALPGATAGSAALDVARTVCRRAERGAVRLLDAGLIENGEVVRYLNRLSDLLWLIGRNYEMDRGADGALRK